MEFKEHYVGDPYTGDKYAKVADPIFWNVNTIMYIDSILHYKNKAGEDKRFYKLKYKKDDAYCHYYGEQQIEFTDECPQ